ncbi:MAG: EF-hand domain-containing protein, partial [Trichlorobacter sp.]|uniref:EF-hand domain-containing protein n=1 Tax=Trichlorobacter sp. TaxID=2911007 RepID=UPI00255EF9F4
MSSVGSIGSSMSSSMLQQMQEERFKKGDINGDSSISKDEFDTLSKTGKNRGGDDTDAMFAQFDSDSDGAISRLESDAAIAKASQEMRGQGMRGQGPPQVMPPSTDSETSFADSSDVSAVFDEMDTNQDGVVSLAEMTEALATSDESESLSRNRNSSSEDAPAQAMQRMDAIEESSASDNSDSLKSILNAALNSYLQ